MEAFLLSGVAGTITLGGGLLALRLQAYRAYIFAFCAGALIAAALIEVVPDAYQLLDSTRLGFDAGHLLLACALGYFVFYVIDHVAHGGHVHHGAAHSDTHQAGLWGAFGLGLHSFFDGFAIGQGFQAGESLGWAIALGVTLHKLADGVSVAGIMLGTQHSVRATRTMVYVVAAAPVLGFLAQSLVTLSHAVLALLLGWFAGIFLYLGASSLLPAAHETSRSRTLLLATLAGALFIFAAQSLSH
ncbi:MAG: ZIP family metal transporter [Thermodesulfobacteriota bacterium]